MQKICGIGWRDRRIDNYVFTNAPGYREYYMSLYAKYFRTKEIGKTLKSDEYREENIESYSVRVINLLNEDRDLDALNGLRDIVKVLDLNNITRLKSSFDALSVAVDITEIIFNNINWDNEIEQTKNNPSTSDASDTSFNNTDYNDPPENKENDKSDNSDDNKEDKGNSSENSDDDDNNQQQSSSASSPSGNNSDDSENSNDSDSDEKDANDNKNKLSKTLKKRVENQLKKQKDFMEGNLKKKSASKKDQEAMKAEQSGSEIVQVGTDVHTGNYYKARSIDCIIVKNLTNEVIDSNEFPMKYYNRDQFSKNSVEKGIVMGRSW